MSYSRWGNSYWYTYWRAFYDPELENRNNAIFEISGVGSFTAAEIRKNINLCLEIIKLETS